MKTGVPIVPIYIKGSYGILRPDSLFIRPASVCVKVGPEMPTAGHSVDKLEKIMDELRNRIVALHDEIDRPRA